MTEDKILQDFKFRVKCAKYGLRCEDMKICGDVIYVCNPITHLYVMFDKHYQTIGVERLETHDDIIASTFLWGSALQTEEQFIERYHYLYSHFANYTQDDFDKKFGYPLENYTLKEIMDMANQVGDIITNNAGGLVSIGLNDNWLDKSFKNIDTFQAFAYMKFIGDEIQNFFLLRYHMLSIGLDCPDVCTYVRNLVQKVNEHTQGSNNLSPSELLSCLGQISSNAQLQGMLFEIIDLLGKELDLSDLFRQLPHGQQKKLMPVSSTDKRK